MLQAGGAGMLNKVAGHSIIRRRDLRPALPAARVPQIAVLARRLTVAKVTGVAKLLQSGTNVSAKLDMFHRVLPLVFRQPTRQPYSG
jgi:hypothetical protein